MESIPHFFINSGKRRGGTDKKSFRLDLTSMPCAKPVTLVQEPSADPLREIGKLTCQRADGSHYPLPEPQMGEEGTPDHDSEHSSLHTQSLLDRMGLTTVLAWTSESGEVFGKDGTYDATVGRRLIDQLSSDDLRTQRAAVEVLIREAPKSFQFMKDALGGPSVKATRTPALVRNISEALEGIEQNGINTPTSLKLNIALSLYEDGDYERAGRFFAQIDENDIRRRDDRFYRAFALGAAGYHEMSIDGYKNYINRAPDGYARAAAYNGIALQHYYLLLDTRDDDHFASAEKYYRFAIQADSRFPASYNNLAFLYAVHRTKLKSALSLINQALRFDPRSANYLDTKGWVLYQSGEIDEALTYLLRAAKINPYDRVIREHLAEVRATHNR